MADSSVAYASGSERDDMPTVADLVQALEAIAPLGLAETWDNVGLLIGDPASDVLRIMTCLTLTPESAGEAIEEGVSLIVSHHPVLFRPTQRLTTATSEGRMLLAIIRAGIAVYSPHTAFDNAPGGINDTLAARLELNQVTPLRPAEAARECKIVVFVPDADLAGVSDALFAAGAGRIGQYRECSFRLAGTGTFFGEDAANPTVGQKGRREEVAEWRLEAICPEVLVDQAVAAMRRAHSYEEPACDVYPLRPTPGGGAGRIGMLPKPASLEALGRQVKNALSASAVQTVGATDRAVQRVAVACGAAGSFIPDAVRRQVDALLTGEVRFHEGLAAEAQGLALVVAGHYATERCGVEDLASRLEASFPALSVWASRRERNSLQLAP
jgi:dinuclear metal center YbgI/SA1388 family protein